MYIDVIRKKSDVAADANERERNVRIAYTASRLPPLAPPGRVSRRRLLLRASRPARRLGAHRFRVRVRSRTVSLSPAPRRDRPRGPLPAAPARPRPGAAVRASTPTQTRTSAAPTTPSDPSTDPPVRARPEGPRGGTSPAPRAGIGRGRAASGRGRRRRRPGGAPRRLRGASGARRTPQRSAVRDEPRTSAGLPDSTRTTDRRRTEGPGRGGPPPPRRAG